MIFIYIHGNSLVVRWLGLDTFTLPWPGFGWENIDPQAMQYGQKPKILCAFKSLVKISYLGT